MRYLTILASVLVLSACAYLPGSGGAGVEGPNDKPLTHTPISFEGEPGEFPSQADQKRCVDAGGEVMQAGLLGGWGCILPYADAGAVCTDASDCLGKCIADDSADNPRPGAKGASGFCEANDSPFGCYTTISDGRIDGTLCVD